MGTGPFPLGMSGGDRPPRQSEAPPLVGRWKGILTELGLGGAMVGGPGQGLEEVVEETRAQRLVHPLAGEEQVVHLVHALDVAGAVLLLGLQPRGDVWSGREVEVARYSDPWWPHTAGFRPLSEGSKAAQHVWNMLNVLIPTDTYDHLRVFKCCLKHRLILQWSRGKGQKSQM